MTRIILIVLTWVLLGVLFFTIKQNCCGTQPATQLPSATSVSKTTATEKASTAEVTEEKASLEDGMSTNAIPDTTEKPVDQLQRTETPTYDHNAYSTIKSLDDKSVIPYTEEDQLNVEVQALLEETCAKLSRSLSKVKITAYGENKTPYLRKMEDFLIRCGLSPGRVDLSQKSKNDTYAEEIVLQVL